MQLQKYEVAGSVLDLIDALNKHLLDLDRSRFTQVGSAFVYDDVLKASKLISFSGKDYVNIRGAIVNLDEFEQKYLYQLASDKFSIFMRHGRLGENRIAAREVMGYRKNCLIPYWLFTGENIFQKDDGFEVRRLGKVEPKEIYDFVPEYIAEDENGNRLRVGATTKTTVLRGIFGPVLQTDVAKHSGLYSTLSEVVPKSNEVSGDGKDDWGGVNPDKYGNSAVWSVWDSDEQRLVADADRPLGRNYDGASGVWTDENPKK